MALFSSTTRIEYGTIQEAAEAHDRRARRFGPPWGSDQRNPSAGTCIIDVANSTCRIDIRDRRWDVSWLNVVADAELRVFRSTGHAHRHSALGLIELCIHTRKPSYMCYGFPESPPKRAFQRYHPRNSALLRRTKLARPVHVEDIPISRSIG